MESLIRRLRDAQAMTKLIGESPTFLKAIAPLPTIARTGATVLISGETGTGKELVARAIHYLSERAGSAFVAVNCGSLPETLLEDELFGHERGAFTDAHARREGLIAQAEGGTLFLDEVDTLSPKAQIDLLRVVQDRKFRVIGSPTEHSSDVRLLAATNVALSQLVQSKYFRADLYYRLCVFTIHLPPLRERKEDIPALATHFLENCSPVGRAPLKIAPSAYAILVSWHWPGNVRELENAIIRGIHFSHGDTIETEDLDLHFDRKAPAATVTEGEDSRSFKHRKRDMVETFEKDYLNQLMMCHHGNVTLAARAAGKDRRDLGKLLKKYQLNPKLFRTA